MRPDFAKTCLLGLACVLSCAMWLLAMPVRAGPAPLTPAQREVLRGRIAAWEALPPASRNEMRRQMQSWLLLPPLQQAALRASAADFARLPPEQQAAMRVKFAALTAEQQHGWRLGPDLGPYYPRLHPLIAYVPPAERAPLLQTLHAMAPQELELLGRLVFSTPPSGRDALRQALIRQHGAGRLHWLMVQMER